MRHIIGMMLLLLWVGTTTADEYWRGWCAGAGHVRQITWMLERDRAKQSRPLTPTEKYVLAKEYSGLWTVHGEPLTFLWNGDGGPVWLTCPSGETRAYDPETPGYGASNPTPKLFD